MGQKVNPIIFRIPYIKSWDSRWFARRDSYARLVEQDTNIKKFVKEKLRNALIAKVEIERSRDAVTVIVHAAKPGIIIGRGGAGVEDLKKEVTKKFLSKDTTVKINILEVKNPSSTAQVVVQTMILDIEKRVPFRTVMKHAIMRAEKDGVKGIKLQVAGRLNGAEIARTEMLLKGKIPLHTLRADIDYGRGVARTTYGAIGIKVWIYKGEIFN